MLQYWVSEMYGQRMRKQLISRVFFVTQTCWAMSMKHHFVGDRVLRTLTTVKIPATLVVVLVLSLVVPLEIKCSNSSASTQVNDLAVVHDIMGIGSESVTVNSLNLDISAAVIPAPQLSEGEMRKICGHVHTRADVVTWVMQRTSK